MAQRPSPPRGMRDLLPDVVLTRRELLRRILETFEQYGFTQIETPLLEEIERLHGSEGGENEKLIYKVLRRGIGDNWPPKSEADAVDLGLRFDLTVPLARYWATNSESLPHPFKAIQTGPVFRAERPQKGRYRQFTQCDIDVIGDASPMVEVELICAMADTLRACDIHEFVMRINDRRLVDALVKYAGFRDEEITSVMIAIDKLDKIGVEGVHAELLRIHTGTPTKVLTETLEALDGTRGFSSTLDVLASSVPTDVLEDLSAILQGVHSPMPDVRIELDPTLVRGMGYYTGTIFEIENAESSGALGGGGRYDNMVQKLAGMSAPAAGFSIGFERLCDVLHGRITSQQSVVRVALLHAKDEALPAVARVAHSLREQGDIVRREVKVKNRAAQLNRLKAAGFTHWTELVDGKAAVPMPIEAKDAKEA